MISDSPQPQDLKRKPPRTARRIRFSELPEPLQRQAIDNLIFHRDAESVSRRFQVHQGDLVENFGYWLYDRMRDNGRPNGPTNVIAFRRAA